MNNALRKRLEDMHREWLGIKTHKDDSTEVDITNDEMIVNLLEAIIDALDRKADCDHQHTLI